MEAAAAPPEPLAKENHGNRIQTARKQFVLDFFEIFGILEVLDFLEFWGILGDFGFFGIFGNFQIFFRKFSKTIGKIHHTNCF